jgi:outer membrane protein assembly factor BamB
MKAPCLWLLLIFVSLQSSAQVPSGSRSSRRSDDLILRASNYPQCPVGSVAPQVLSDGRMLFGSVDTVYVVASDGAISWKYVAKGPAQPLSLYAPPAFNAKTNEVGVIGCDLFFVRLDGTSGKEKWRYSGNSSSEFKQIAPYGSGFLLVISSDEGDSLQYWSDSEDDLRQAEFPSGATLIVNGAKIYAIRSLNRSIRVREIHLLPSH